MTTWKVKPTATKEILPAEAMKILKQLEEAVHYDNRRKYNRILKELQHKYPDMANLIESHFKKSKPHLQSVMQLSPEEKMWIRSWKEIHG